MIGEPVATFCTASRRNTMYRVERCVLVADHDQEQHEYCPVDSAAFPTRPVAQAPHE